VRELLLSDEFRTYRKHQIKKIVDVLSPMLMNPKDDDLIKMKGAIEMAQKLIRLPETLLEGKKDKKLLSALVVEDLKEFQVRFIRSHLIEE